MSLDLRTPEAAKMWAGKFIMALFATPEEMKRETEAEDNAKVEQATQYAKIAGIPFEDAYHSIGKVRLPEGVDGFIKIKKSFLPKGFMAEENDDGLRIQAAVRIMQTLKGDLVPDESMDPKIFPDTPARVAITQSAFKSVLSRKVSTVAAPKHDFDDNSAKWEASLVIAEMLIKYSHSDKYSGKRDNAYYALKAFSEYMGEDFKATVPPVQSAGKPKTPGL